MSHMPRPIFLQVPLLALLVSLRLLRTFAWRLCPAQRAIYLQHAGGRSIVSLSYTDARLVGGGGDSCGKCCSCALLRPLIASGLNTSAK